MRFPSLLALATGALLCGCQVGLPASGDEVHLEVETAAEVREEPAERSAIDGAELRALARRSGRETVCQAFARKLAEAALHHGSDVDGFLAELQQEFVGGTDDPFEMKAGLTRGDWNQRYFYAGHGGFRPEYDDAHNYPRGGNHQPGHFVSVLSIAARFGEEQARIAIAVAGDYEPGQEDDLRLSMVAIPLGVGLGDGTISPGEVAREARALCRD